MSMKKERTRTHTLNIKIIKQKKGKTFDKSATDISV